MADRRGIQSDPEIPDLDLPGPRSAPASPGRPAPTTAPLPGQAPRSPIAITESTEDFGMDIDRGNVSAPPTAQAFSGKPIALGVSDSDDFEMEIERGGALVSAAPRAAGRPPATTSGRPITEAQGSGLEISYRRLSTDRSDDESRSVRGGWLAYLVTGLVSVGTAALLARLAHRPGGRSLTAALPHAFDATSTTESGLVAISALVVGIGLGFAGSRLSRRSYAMIASAAMLLIASLAMVTVTLVATDEHPTPPDGALLIPYVLPLAIFLLGIGIAGLGVPLFQHGGRRRAAAVLLGSIGGALVFAAAEVSVLATVP